MIDFNCETCTMNAPLCDAHTVTARVENGNALMRFYFCSAFCWTQWLKALPLETYETVILPPLDGYDIAGVQRGMRKKVA